MRSIFRKVFDSSKAFSTSENYWVERYNSGRNSGAGSYDDLAEFKAEILNDFVRSKEICSVIEYGCGDGNQLKLAEYPSYVGFDVAPKAIDMCKEAFAHDDTKLFKAMDSYNDESADLTLSLDVIYHLVEDNVFSSYMNRLFSSSNKFVIIYSSDTDVNPENTAAHVRHRNFSKWIIENLPEWKLYKHIPNRYPFKGSSKTGSFADFFIYKKH